MDDQVKIMLAMSLFKPSVVEANKTANAFAAALPDSSMVALRVETDGLARARR